ncbi:class I SAM-dependent methyltransferase, partial [Alphaproteobacteria bacterium]|nr:class I SAM-dependent methyltransferase [Alphaproteobacteria bacterium]
LDILCDKYGSDKGFLDLKKRKLFMNRNPHNYTNVYHSLLNHCKDDIKLILECGIGTNNPNIKSSMGIDYKPGASLFMWKDYFKNADIFGCDIDENILFNHEDRIKTFYVDQLSSHTIKKMWSDINRKDFDLIIDDGLHSFNAAKFFFDNSFQYLKSGGLYIIEDIGLNYMNLLLDYLQDYKVEVIRLSSNRVKTLADNNMMIIRKN